MFDQIHRCRTAIFDWFDCFEFLGSTYDRSRRIQIRRHKHYRLSTNQPRYAHGAESTETMGESYFVSGIIACHAQRSVVNHIIYIWDGRPVVSREKLKYLIFNF
jgi:hypothetical protein